MAFCPLCKSEYQAGFTDCSDCHAVLVPTREGAYATNVTVLWEGSSQSKFNDIAGALQDAGIPNCSQSAARSQRRPQSLWRFVPYVGTVLKMMEAKKQIGWQVSVLESDQPRAEMTTRHLLV